MPRCHQYPPLSAYRDADPDCEKRPEESEVNRLEDGGCTAFVHPLNTSTDPEKGLFDCWAAESTDIGAIDMLYYPVGQGITPVDDPVLARAKDKAAALYGEVNKTPHHAGPFKMRGSFTVPDKALEAYEESLQLELRADVEIARTEFERLRLPAPRAHDIIRVWGVPFFALWGQPHHEDVEKSGFFFEVLKSDITGFPFGGPEFTMFRLTLKRDSRYAAERHLTGDIPDDYDEELDF
jgi:hypothetical protein